MTATDLIPTALAEKLKRAGLAWNPTEGDRFVLPDREMVTDVFTISHMVVEVRPSPGGRLIAFNGTTEWALDAIEQAETTWLPREAQLREALGEALLSLVRGDGDWRCTFRLGGELAETTAETPAEAYALSLLQVLAAGNG